MVYLPLSERYGAFSIVARTRGAPEQLVPLLREAVRSTNPAVPLTQEATMEALVAESSGAERFRTLLVIAFGFLATFLALVGVFGVTARSVAHRSREMGIRMALGARSGELIRMVALGTLRAGWVSAWGFSGRWQARGSFRCSFSGPELGMGGPSAERLSSWALSV